jgi:hypothetical protein
MNYWLARIIVIRFCFRSIIVITGATQKAIAAFKIGRLGQAISRFPTHASCCTARGF